MGEPKGIRRTKSMNDIERQRKRLESSMRDAYHNAESINSNKERQAEFDRLNARMARINAIAQRYYNNISETPEYRNAIRQWGQSMRGGAGREERRAIINSAQERQYSRARYMGRKNNR